MDAKMVRCMSVSKRVYVERKRDRPGPLNSREQGACLSEGSLPGGSISAVSGDHVAATWRGADWRCSRPGSVCVCRCGWSGREDSNLRPTGPKMQNA